MYVCVCNQLTDSHVRDAASAGATRPSEVYRECGCAKRCGACSRSFRQIINEVGGMLLPSLAVAN
jgi:bacterioferritin-associated ferredoxin